jgi:hypothetical protein
MNVLGVFDVVILANRRILLHVSNAIHWLF